MPEPPALEDFPQFWDHYLGEHSKPATRWIHGFGTLAGVLLAFVSILTHWWWGLPAALVAGYSPAWFSHFFIEKNKPATFRHPLWSLVADFRMGFLLLADLWKKLTGP